MRTVVGVKLTAMDRSFSSGTQGRLQVPANVHQPSDLPNYRPSFWHLTLDGGKKPNPYMGDEHLEPYFNKLTTRRFEW